MRNTNRKHHLRVALKIIKDIRKSTVIKPAKDDPIESVDLKLKDPNIMSVSATDAKWDSNHPAVIDTVYRAVDKYFLT